MRLLVGLSLLAAALGCAAPQAVSPHLEENLEARDPRAAEELPDDPPTMEQLALGDPVAFVRQSIARYDREVSGYRCTLEKRERIGGRVQPVEVVECSFREKPFSVRMDWIQGARLAKRTAYVQGQNNGNLLVLGAGWREWLVGVVERPADGADARSSSRFPVTEFGLQIGARRALSAWQAAERKGELQVEYGGVQTPEVLGGRRVWQLKRIGYAQPEDDGITEATLYFDVETWLLVGSEMSGEGGRHIGSYYFRDVVLNPEFAETTFARAGLMAK